MSMTIPLTNSDQTAAVDTEDFELVSKFSWFLKRSARNSYACASLRIGNRVLTIRMQRLIAAKHLGKLPGDHTIHHIDADVLNNRWSNLEALGRKEHGILTRAMNQRA